MKILLAADGSKYTKKALAFVVNHDGICGDDEIVVLNVQTPVPLRLRAFLEKEFVDDFYRTDAQKVLKPIERFLQRHSHPFTVKWAVGTPEQEIARAAKKEKAQMIVMGTHGHGAVGRALMGSVAQAVVTQSEVPVLLVK